MEKLTDVQRQRVNKMSDARIVQKLLQVGMPLEKLELMDRPALLAAMADVVAAGKETPAAVATVSQGAYDVELEKLKFEWQKQCYEREQQAQQQEKQERLQLEQERLRVEQQEKQERLQLEQQEKQERFRLEQQRLEAQERLERQKLEWEEKRLALELAAKREDRDRQERAWKANADEEKEEEYKGKTSSAARAKVFGDAMHGQRSHRCYSVFRER